MSTLVQRYPAIASPSFVVGAVILSSWLGLALLAAQIAPHDPVQTVSAARQPPSTDFWFGTDRLGRDVASRVVYGARVSLLLGFISVAIGAIAGTVLGVVSG